MKKNHMWIALFAFLFGQLIQLVTNAMAHYLYVSDPVIMCLTVGIVTVALVVMTAVFMAMPTEPTFVPAHTAKKKYDDFPDVIPRIFMDRRAPKDAEPMDIRKIEEDAEKENEYEAL